MGLPASTGLKNSRTTTMAISVLFPVFLLSFKHFRVLIVLHRIKTQDKCLVIVDLVFSQ